MIHAMNIGLNNKLSPGVKSLLRHFSEFGLRVKSMGIFFKFFFFLFSIKSFLPNETPGN